MGKGNGEHLPQKFLNDQYFCQIFLMTFAGGIVTMSSLTVGMDDGGSFPYPYAFAGFILGPIVIVNLISRGLVLRALNKKGLSRNNIVNILNTTKFGSILWPWSCRLGMMWCIPAVVLTGLGGVNCRKEKKDGEMKVDNTCYYNVEGTHAAMYKGMAIAAVCIYCFSFIFLMLSLCPVQTVLDQIKEDPKPKAKTAPKPAANKDATPAAKSTPQAANQVSPSTSTGGATGGGERDKELEKMTKQLEEKTKALEKREKQLEEMERKAQEANVLPVLPSYDELMGETNGV